MNSTTLAATRIILNAAVAVTGFIVLHSQKIIAVAKVVHVWALNAVEKANAKTVDKAFYKAETLRRAAIAVQVDTDIAYRAACRADRDAQITLVALRAELSTLA